MCESLVSIIVPIYNCEKYLKECIESLINQTYRNIEIILIDDGSFDSSGDICDMYAGKDSRIKVVHQQNSGVSKARNNGIDLSRGEYITFVDSDDYVDESYCEALISAFDKETTIVIARTISFSDTFIDDGYRGGEVDVFNSDQEKNELYKAVFIDNKRLNPYPHISTCSAKMIKRAVILENGIVYNSSLKVYEDALFNMNIINVANKVKVIDRKIYFYRNYTDSSSNCFNYDLICQYRYALGCIVAFEKENNLSLSMYYDYFRIKNLNTLLKNYFADTPKIKEFYKLLKDVYREYKAPIRNVEIKYLPKRRKFMVACLRVKMYFLVFALYSILK